MRTCWLNINKDTVIPFDSPKRKVASAVADDTFLLWLILFFDTCIFLT
jgi:hypothetical protein